MKYELKPELITQLREGKVSIKVPTNKLMVLNGSAKNLLNQILRKAFPSMWGKLNAEGVYNYYFRECYVNNEDWTCDDIEFEGEAIELLDFLIDPNSFF